MDDWMAAGKAEGPRLKAEVESKDTGGSMLDAGPKGEKATKEGTQPSLGSYGGQAESTEQK